MAAVSLHIQPASGVVPLPAEVLPQPGRRGQRLHLQVWHKELQQGLPFYVLCSSKTALPMGRGDLEFFSSQDIQKLFFFFFAQPGQFFLSSDSRQIVKLNLGSYDGKLSFLIQGVYSKTETYSGSN